MHRSLYILAGGFLTGVGMRSCFVVGEVVVIGLLCFIPIFALLAMQLRLRTSWYSTLFVCALVLGMVRTEYAALRYTEVQAQAQGFIASDALVVREPDVRDGHTFLTLRLMEHGGETPVVVRAKVPTYPMFSYGDYVRVTGLLEVPLSFQGETGRVFDYAAYLRKEGIHYVLAEPSVEATGQRTAHAPYTQLYALKAAWIRAVSQGLPEPGAALAGGLVVGAKQSLGEHWLELFRVTGIIHIVVLSGYNLTLIADVIVRAGRRLPRRAGLALAMSGVVGFMLMAGASATVVRATIMALLVLVATHAHRPQSALRMLTLACVGMVAWNPFVLVSDTGFQLSFIATLGLIVYAPHFERLCAWVPARFGLRDIVAATCATQIAVLPLLLYSVGQVSLIAPLVNVLVLPVIPYIMALVFLGGVFGMVVAFLAPLFLWPAHLLLGYVFTVVTYAAKVPFAAVSLPPLSAWVLLILYLALVGVSVVYAQHRAS
jgi:competence protein ComEC